MSPDERTEAEASADRALRRGELAAALSLFQTIATAFPADEGVQLKLKRIREHLQPMELTSAKTRVPLDQAPPPTNSIQSAEALAARGEYAEAIALYRKALEKRPDSDLIRERLAELFQIAQAMAPRATPSAPASAPRPPPPSRASSGPNPVTPLPRKGVTPSAPHPLTPLPREALTPGGESQAPVSTARLLSDLLDQISRRRRSRPATG